MSPPPLTFLHTAESHVALFGRLLARLAPDVPVRHEVRADLLARAVAAGGTTPEVEAATQATMRALAADGAPTVCTCSTLGGAAAATADAVGPVQRIDRAMADRAVAAGSHLLVVAAIPTTLGPTETLLRQAARDAGRAVDVRMLLVEGAWPLFLAGHGEGYLARVAEAVRRALDAAPADAVVLSQASMADAAELLAGVGVPVLSSPVPGVEAAVALWRSLATPADGPEGQKNLLHTPRFSG